VLKVLGVLISERAELHAQTPGGRHDVENERRLSQVSEAVRLQSTEVRALHGELLLEIKEMTRGGSEEGGAKQGAVPFLEEGILRMWAELEQASISMLKKAGEPRIETETEATPAGPLPGGIGKIDGDQTTSQNLRLDVRAKARCMVAALSVRGGAGGGILCRCVASWRLEARSGGHWVALDHVFTRIRLDCGLRLLTRHMIRNEHRLLARASHSWHNNQTHSDALIEIQDLQMAIGTVEFQTEAALQEKEGAEDRCRELERELDREISSRPPLIPIALSPEKKARLPGQKLAFRVVFNFLSSQQRIDLKRLIDQWVRSLHAEIKMLLQEALSDSRYASGARLLRALIGGSSIYRAFNAAIGNWLTNGGRENETFAVGDARTRGLAGCFPPPSHTCLVSACRIISPPLPRGSCPPNLYCWSTRMI